MELLYHILQLLTQRINFLLQDPQLLLRSQQLLLKLPVLDFPLGYLFVSLIDGDLEVPDLHVKGLDAGLCCEELLLEHDLGVDWTLELFLDFDG